MRLSLLVPSKRGAACATFLWDVAETADRPETLEIILVRDAGADPIAVPDALPGLTVVSAQPGLTVMALNAVAGDRATGDIVGLLNDDIRIETRGWDTAILQTFSGWRDGVGHVFPDDGLMAPHLGIFPFVDRTTWQMLQPALRGFVRYRVDDTIHDAFRCLAWMGFDRSVYLPDQRFRHLNVRETPNGLESVIEEASMDLDGPRYDAMAHERNTLASALARRIAEVLI